MTERKGERGSEEKERGSEEERKRCIEEDGKEGGREVVRK